MYQAAIQSDGKFYDGAPITTGLFFNFMLPQGLFNLIAGLLVLAFPFFSSNKLKFKRLLLTTGAISLVLFLIPLLIKLEYLYTLWDLLKGSSVTRVGNYELEWQSFLFSLLPLLAGVTTLITGLLIKKQNLDNMP